MVGGGNDCISVFCVYPVTRGMTSSISKYIQVYALVSILV